MKQYRIRICELDYIPIIDVYEDPCCQIIVQHEKGGRCWEVYPADREGIPLADSRIAHSKSEAEHEVLNILIRL